jgi:transposase-like protein
LDETCVKVNGLEYWVYAALDVDRNEIYECLSSKYSYHQQFIDEVLNYCIGGPAFIVDNAPWLKHALEELGLTYNTKPFR